MLEQREGGDLASSTLAGALFHQTGDALLVVDPISERVLDANANAVRLTEFSRDELVRFSLRALVRHEQEWQDWRIGSAASTPLPGSDSFLLRTRQPDRWVPVSVNVTRLQLDQGDPVVLWRLRDRRELLESQRRVNRVEAELRRLLSSVSDAVYSGRIEPDGRWLLRYVSPRVQPMIGLPPALLDNLAAREQAVAPDDQARWRELMARVASGQPGELEYRLRRPDGSLVWVRESIVVSPDEGGLLIHGVLTDISDRKKIERESTASNDEHARRLDGLAHVLGVVAHDLDDLLVGLTGNLELARLDPALATTCLARIAEVARNVSDHGKLLAKLAGKEAAAGSVDLASLARRVAGEIAPGPGQRLDLDLAAELPAAAGDEAALAAVLRHLLGNAFDSLEGRLGEVQLALFQGACPPAEGTLLRYPVGHGEPCLCLEVADSGTGLSPEARARLFEPYFSTRPGRRGLGLATVLGVVRGLGGSIEVAAPREGGTVFRVRLPEAAAEASGAPDAPAEGSPPAEVVLVIDDEESVRDVARRLLMSLGYQVLTAADGTEGLACLRDHPEIQGVLMDWRLPGLSGERLIEELRHLSPAVSISVMSGYPEQELRTRLDDLRLFGFLQKPFRLTDLAAAVPRARD